MVQAIADVSRHPQIEQLADTPDKLNQFKLFDIADAFPLCPCHAAKIRAKSFKSIFRFSTSIGEPEATNQIERVAERVAETSQTLSHFQIS